jgi:PAS domain S-box-containing protein
MRAVPLYGDDGSVREWIGTVTDFTERRESEEALRAREERYRVLYNSVEEGFCIVEVLFNEQGEPVDHRYVEVNPAFERQIGVKDVVGKRASELLPGDAGKWHAFCAEVLRTGQTAHMVERVDSLDRWLEVSGVRLGDAGSRQVALLFSDISAAKRTEQELRQLATDLAESNRRQGEFLATLAHELRNPLAPIRSGLDLMRLSGANPAALERVRVMLERQVDHLVHLVDDLMDLARINSGKVELKKTLVSLNDILARAVEISTPMLRAKDHVLTQVLPDETPWLMADGHRLTQVVSNLLTNAAKYTPAQGQVKLVAYRDGPWAVIEVTDTGIGIPSEALGHIFEMFTQVGHGLDHAQGGLGIGLNLVKRLVEGHGGSVSAQSEGAARGSRFTVRLPLAEHAPDAAGADQKGGHGAQAGLRILIADDNADAVELLAQLLELKGHEVRIARDGRSALDAAREAPPDLALLDIGMPGMNGYEVARALRATPGLEHVTLAALTGWGGQDDRVRSREAGFQHHLTKPINLQTLEGLLATLELPRSS